jgi:hypothetical protein
MFNNGEYQYTHISAGSSTQVFIGRGTLFAVNINQSSAVVFDIYDGVSSTVQPVALLKASIAEQTLIYNASISSGLYITYGAGGDYTVLWAKS